MAEPMTLEQLKAENASTTEQAQEPEQVEQEELQDEPEVTEPEQQEEAKQDGETESEQDEEKPEIESWMQEEVATPSDDEDSGFKPNPQAAAVRKKLRAKLSEKDDELEQLKAKIAQLESGAGQQAQQSDPLPPRPKLEDYDYDDDKHAEALDEWYDKKFEAKAKQTFSATQSKEQQQAEAERQKKALDDAVNRHYERAYKLVSDGKVSEEKYTQADRAVRESFERLANGKGDLIVDHLIKTLDSLGEGSEKVMYQLGVNPARLQEVQNLYASDPSGLSAVAFLGRLQANITTPVKRKSSAPKPSPELSGSGSGKSPADKLHQQYKKAGSNLQRRIDLKREAKRQGVDTSKW